MPRMWFIQPTRVASSVLWRYACLRVNHLRSSNKKAPNCFVRYKSDLLRRATFFMRELIGGWMRCVLMVWNRKYGNWLRNTTQNFPPFPALVIASLYRRFLALFP